MKEKPKKIKGLKLVLENCEVLYLDLSHKPYYHFNIGKSCKSYLGQSGDFFLHDHTNYFYFKMDLKEFQDNLSNINYAGRDGETQSKEESWNRFKYKDCTSIGIIFEDDTEYSTYIPWKGEWKNKVQHIRIIKADKYHEDLLEIYFDYNFYWNQFKFRIYLFFKKDIGDFFYKVSQIFKKK